MDIGQPQEEDKKLFSNKTLLTGLFILGIGIFFATFPAAEPADEPATDLFLSMPVTEEDEFIDFSAQVQEETPQAQLVSLGEYKITFYCKCVKCCGKSDGITATGTIATAGKTIAVDPKVIALGSKVIIDGDEYIAEDTGGFKGQTIDMFVDSHQDALSRGVIRREIFIESE